MTTITMPIIRTTPETATRPQTGSGSQTPRCDGCPRCQDANAPLCHLHHEKYAGRHPVCRLCRHCVLRGKHADDASDLDEHPGFKAGQGIQISNN